MNNAISKYLNSEQEGVIRDAVRQAEAGTSGEIAPMLVAESSGYREAAVHAAVIMASMLSLTTLLLVNDTSVWLFIPVTFALYFPLLILARHLPWLKLTLTPAALVSDAVRLRAVRAFHEMGLHRTREENGILIFISLLERRVWILGDRGINAVIPPERWSSLASALASGIREGRMTESVVTTIAEVGEILKKHFPRRTDDTNELPDLMGD